MRRHRRNRPRLALVDDHERLGSSLRAHRHDHAPRFGQTPRQVIRDALRGSANVDGVIRTIADAVRSPVTLLQDEPPRAPHVRCEGEIQTGWDVFIQE